MKKDNQKDEKISNKEESSRQRLKGLSFIKAFLFFAVYIAILVLVGVQAVSRSGETNKKKISIYKEATPTDADTDIEGVTKNEKENTKDHLELAQPAELKKVDAVSAGQDYNGIDLKDNGMPYAIKINRKENIVTVYSLDTDGGYTVPVKAFRCSVSLDDTTPAGLFTTTENP